MTMSNRVFLLLILPVAVFAGLLYYAIFWNVYIATHDYTPISRGEEYIGWKGFEDLVSSPEFAGAFKRTLLWAALLVLLGNAVGLLLASSIYQFTSARVRNTLTTLFLYPLSLSLVVVGIIWRWLYDQYKGFNVVVGGGPAWLEGENAFWSILLTSVWVYAGFSAMLYLAAFYNVDRSLIESAMVDGAGTLTILARIVLPNSSQGLILSTIFLALFAIQMFDLPYSMLFLNPFTETMVMYIFSKFTSLYLYLASAAAIVIIAVSAFIVIPYALYGIRRWILRGAS